MAQAENGTNDSKDQFNDSLDDNWFQYFCDLNF